MSTNTASAYKNQPRNKHSLGWFVSKVGFSLASHFQPDVFWSTTCCTTAARRPKGLGWRYEAQHPEGTRWAGNVLHQSHHYTFSTPCVSFFRPGGAEKRHTIKVKYHLAS